MQQLVWAAAAAGRSRGLLGGGARLPEDTRYMLLVSCSGFSLAISSQDPTALILFFFFQGMCLPHFYHQHAFTFIIRKNIF